MAVMQKATVVAQLIEYFTSTHKVLHALSMMVHTNGLQILLKGMQEAQTY